MFAAEPAFSCILFLLYPRGMKEIDCLKCNNSNISTKRENILLMNGKKNENL